MYASFYEKLANWRRTKISSIRHSHCNQSP